jgi:hypothetical protein
VGGAWRCWWTGKERREPSSCALLLPLAPSSCTLPFNLHLAPSSCALTAVGTSSLTPSSLTLSLMRARARDRQTEGRMDKSIEMDGSIEREGGRERERESERYIYIYIYIYIYRERERERERETERERESV